MMENHVSSYELIERIEEFLEKYQEILTKVLKKHRVNRSAFVILNLIQRETYTLTELTAISNLDKSTLSRQVSVLVSKGWVIKENRNDKRSTYLSLSKEALKLTQVLSTELEEIIDLILKGWPNDEKQLFLILLGRMNRSIDLYKTQQDERD